LATNRDLADDIPKDAILHSEHAQSFKEIRCITHPRSVPYQYQKGDYLWKLIAQLSLNHMSFSDPQYALDALQEVLRLHAQRAQNDMAADCIEKIEVVPAVKRLGEEHWRGFVRGFEIVLHMKDFDADSYLLFLMSKIIHIFLSNQVGINSFVSLKVIDSESKQEKMVWEPKAGKQKLL